jgi:hypothetical protein
VLMKPKLTPWFWAGLLLLTASFVLTYIVVAFYSRSQVSHLMGGGISATDFAAPYFFVINRGAMLGLLLALAIPVYWRIRFHVAADALQLYGHQHWVIHFTLLLLPVLVALLAALALALYLQQTEGAFSRYDRFLQP